jgi:hypothetical protein
MVSAAEQGWPSGAVLRMDGFDPGAADTSVTRALGIADGVRRRSATGVPGPGCMAAFIDRVDGGRQLHEGVKGS